MNEPRTAETPKNYTYSVSVKFDNSSRAYSFGTENPDLKNGDAVVVETQQGVELGRVQGTPQSTSKMVPCRMPQRPVLRAADEEDLQDYETNKEYSREAYEICSAEITNLGLNMHLLRAEYMLDRSKILFIYQSEQRVDFRELLKRLGSQLHCRIELRQIGERDKAKMVGGIGMCGMECCCSRFKTHMDVISINMAKTQLLALNTEKLSGMCGKLMCCLKYENDNYKELTEGLPKMGAHVEYDGVMYRVASMNVMSNEARLENSETYQVISIEDLRTKAIVRKGVTVGRKSPQRSAGKPAHIAPGVRNVETPADFRATNSEKNRGISSESKKVTPASDLSDRRRPRRTDAHAGLKPQESAPKKPAARPAGPRRPKHPVHTETNNPNVTVRSFKSRKKAETEKEEAK
ncbi:MAG: regulatory iron-sulfur-containing complex subunit RicT [Bulleidia sp.]